MKIRIKFPIKIYIVLYLFVLLFSPPIIKINIIIPLAIYSLGVMLIKYPKQLIRTLNDRICKKFITMVLCLLSYWLFICLINFIGGNFVNLMNYFTSLYQYFLLFPIAFICVLYIMILTNKHNIDIVELIKLIICAGLIELVFCLISLIDINIKSKLLDIMFNNTGYEQFQSEWITSRRYYGFSNSLADLFGYGTGLLALLPFVVEGKWAFLSFPLLLVPLLNSRTGILVYLLGLFFLYIKNFYKNKRNLFKFIAIIAIFIISSYCLYTLLLAFSPNTIEWISNDVSSFINSSQEGTATNLLSKSFWTFPDMFLSIFGTGHTIYGANGFDHSDVGYVNDLWKLGVVGTSSLYFAYCRFISRARNVVRLDRIKRLLTIFEVSFFVFLIKGQYFTAHPGIIIVFLICFKIYMKGTSDANE